MNKTSPGFAPQFHLLEHGYQNNQSTIMAVFDL
jgi:hypothetical protein